MSLQGDRHKQAAARAARMDQKWFARRPFALGRLRDSLAFEKMGWSESDHLRWPYVIVRPADEGQEGFVQQFFNAKQRPDSDQASILAISVVLGALVDRVETEGGDGVATPDECAMGTAFLAELQQRVPNIDRLGMKL